jgi:hypothetical protein
MSNRKYQYNNLSNQNKNKGYNQNNMNPYEHFQNISNNEKNKEQPTIQFFDKSDVLCPKKGNKFYYSGVS